MYENLSLNLNSIANEKKGQLQQVRNSSLIDLESEGPCYPECVLHLYDEKPQRS